MFGYVLLPMYSLCPHSLSLIPERDGIAFITSGHHQTDGSRASVSSGHVERSLILAKQQQQFKAAKSRKSSRGPTVAQVDMLVESQRARVEIKVEGSDGEESPKSKSAISVRDGGAHKAQGSEISDDDSVATGHTRGQRKSIVMHLLTGGSALIREKRKASAAQDTAAAAAAAVAAAAAAAAGSPGVQPRGGATLDPKIAAVVKAAGAVSSPRGGTRRGKRRTSTDIQADMAKLVAMKEAQAKAAAAALSGAEVMPGNNDSDSDGDGDGDEGEEESATKEEVQNESKEKQGEGEADASGDARKGGDEEEKNGAVSAASGSEEKQVLALEEIKLDDTPKKEQSETVGPRGSLSPVPLLGEQGN